jgi:hypothetical protein
MHRERFTVHNVVLLVILFGIAVLLGGNVALPVFVKIPGMLLLGAIAGWVGMGMMPRGRSRTATPALARVSHPSRVPVRHSRWPRS